MSDQNNKPKDTPVHRSSFDYSNLPQAGGLFSSPARRRAFSDIFKKFTFQGEAFTENIQRKGSGEGLEEMDEQEKRRLMEMMASDL